MLLIDFSNISFIHPLLTLRSYEIHKMKLAQLRNQVDVKMENRQRLLDSEMIERSNRLHNNKLRTNDFRENGSVVFNNI